MLAGLGLLLLRLVSGPLLAIHGAQKLFGWFGGYGLAGFAGWLESIGFYPGTRWATMAGWSEFAGGLLTTLGLFNPVGPVTMLAPMVMAYTRVHLGKPIWSPEEPAPELTVTNMAIAGSLSLLGPGPFSLDRALGIRLPRGLVVLTVAATVVGIGMGLANRSPAAQTEVEKGQQAA